MRRGRLPGPQRRRYLTIGAIAIVGLVAVSNLAGSPSASPEANAEPSATAAAATPRATVAAVASPTASTTQSTSGPIGQTDVATVVRVTDGDTIRVALDGQEFPVRYIGMDTPEPDDPDAAIQALAERATAANAALVAGREVILERDVSDTDRFDRLLRDVWVDGPDGPVNVGLELVRQGFAQVSTFPPDVRYTDLLLQAETAARSREAGLWAPMPSVAASQPVAVVDEALTFVGPDERAAFRGAVGEYQWTALAVDGDRATVRWDVRAEDADCRVGWRLEPAEGEVINSTVRVDAGGREEDNRRYDIDFEEAALLVTSTCPAWLLTMQTAWIAADGGGDCDDSYAGVCIPAYPPDLDCGEITERNFAVVGSDPHGFDREGDGIGCEADR